MSIRKAPVLSWLPHQGWQAAQGSLGPPPAGLAHTCTAPASQNAPCLAPIPAEPDPTSFTALSRASTTCWKEGTHVGGQLPLLSQHGQHSDFTLLSASLSPDTLPAPGRTRWDHGGDGRTPCGTKGMSCSTLVALAWPAGGAAKPKPREAVSFLAAWPAGRGTVWKWELSAAMELPTAALGIARSISCQHKGTCLCKQPVREQQTPWRGGGTTLGNNHLLLSCSSKQGNTALGRQERCGEDLGAVGHCSQGPGSVGMCHVSRDMRSGGCAGVSQGGCGGWLC